ncbi:SDR family oxidoreductase [Nonomuraea deserti]|uniref:SDR family oxidoreductase n=1 Tax=Nonomuraea deserti TaxID=1848322 RepID=UPI0034E0C1D2
MLGLGVGRARGAGRPGAAGRPGPASTPLAGMDPATVDRLLAERAADIPLGRVGDPTEIALWASRLLADEWVTGHVIPVDGGMAIA